MAVTIPKTPKTLRTQEGRRWWRAINSNYILEAESLLILETALQAFESMRAAEATIEAEGAVYHDRFGQPRQHPAMLNLKESRGAMLRAIQALGLDLEPVGPVGRPPVR